MFRLLGSQEFHTLSMSFTAVKMYFHSTRTSETPSVFRAQAMAINYTCRVEEVACSVPCDSLDKLQTATQNQPDMKIYEVKDRKLSSWMNQDFIQAMLPHHQAY